MAYWFIVQKYLTLPDVITYDLAADDMKIPIKAMNNKANNKKIVSLNLLIKIQLEKWLSRTYLI